MENRLDHTEEDLLICITNSQTLQFMRHRRMNTKQKTKEKKNNKRNIITLLSGFENETYKNNDIYLQSVQQIITVHFY